MKRIIVISNVDSYFGYCLAHEFLKRSIDSNTEFRLLCHERQLTSELVKLGGQVYELGPGEEDKEKLKHIMRDVSYVILIPEHSLRCYEEGRQLIECAKENDINYIAMVSYIGIEKSKKDTAYLSQIQKLEEKIKRSFDSDSFCIFQTTLLHQFFYYFGPMIENQNKIQLNLHERVKWGTLDIEDVIEAIIQLSTTTKEGVKNQTLFEFTPDSLMKTKDMIQAASHGLNIPDMTYEKVDNATLRDYFVKIHEDKRFKERFNSMFPLGQYLNHHLVQLFMEYLQLLDQLEEFNTTNHLQKAIQRKPTDLQHFFKQNKHQFRQLK